MKKTVKKIVAVSTALILTVGSVNVLFAQSGTTQPQSVDPTGQVNVSVQHSINLDLVENVDFTAELVGSGRTPVQFTLSADKNDPSPEVVFKNLPKGEYTLKVSSDASGFADYTQTVDVDNQASSVKLITGYDQRTYGEGTARPGILLYGDVNGDGLIDENDVGNLVDAIDKNDMPVGFDLSGDDKVNLVDLEYLAVNYGLDEKTLESYTAVPEILIPSDAVTASTGEGTEIKSGDPNTLLESKEGVQLQPADGEKISEENPVSLEFEIADIGTAANADGIVISTPSSNPITYGTVDVVCIDENGDEKTITAPIVTNGVYPLNEDEGVVVTQDGNGNININLGSQVAVKKVTIVVKGTGNNDLAEISHVEFVNGMENRIPDPDMDIPEKLSAVAGSKQFTLSWNPCVNVTGYEVKIEQGGKYEIVKTDTNSLTVTSFVHGKKGNLENNVTYTVSVQSVNGTWCSGYCDPIYVTPKADKKPDKPDYLSATGGYKSIKLSWKNAEDTETNNIYYKLADAEAYTKIEGVAPSSYTLTDLEDKAEYMIYVTGVNELGESGPSLVATASTTDMNPAVVTKYFLINTTEGENEKGAHIVNAWTNGGKMVDSPLDEADANAKSAWATVDGNFKSYYLKDTWDDGGYNPIGQNGLFYEFDEEYTIRDIAFLEYAAQSKNYGFVRINCWDAEGKLTSYDRNAASISLLKDSEGRPYYKITLPKKTQVKKIQIGLGRSYVGANINLSEMYFYRYDTVEDDINALYQDDLHLVLRDDVTQADIDELRVRINTPDEISGELSPDLPALERELQNAEDLLNAVNPTQPIEIHNTITTKDVGRGFTGLNAWQPLGVIASAGDKITVYVGHNTLKSGVNTNLQLVASQYHAESGSAAKVVGTLKTGANIITVPKLWSINEESGGALYIQYTGNNADDRYAVRVSGGVNVPKLDLYGVYDDEAEKLARTTKFIEELQTYVANIEKNHEEYHKNSDNTNVNKFEYSAQNCILGACDIMLDTMMLSLPAQQILAGSGSGTAEQKAATIIDSMKAMEDMMHLFYQHKGLNANSKDALDQIPKGHLNIRYQRMFSGAFMYAGGNHIGIEWGSTRGMVNCSPVVADEDGRYQSGRYFGWGIAHEIGHNINQGAYAVAEVTNNYFAQLAQAKDSNNGMRFTYPNIYKKVTSNTIGQSSNGATQLGMYWQLHLAYDMGYNYKTYEDPTEQLESLFYARMDYYARKPDRAPAPDGVALTLSGGSDQVLMRLACASAEKNVLEFFERWGKVPDSGTIAYASQFEKETRAIYYTDDNSRVYRIENPNGGILGTNGDVEAVGDGTTAKLVSESSSEVNFTLTSKNIPESDILGYEIVRCTIANGEEQKQAVGFTTGSTFTDTVATLNNRVIYYEVTLIDKYLNRSAVKALEPVKIQNDGSVDKSEWTVTATGITPEKPAESEDASDEMPCEPVVENPYISAADGMEDTVFAGTLTADGEIVMEFNQFLTISGFKYRADAYDAIGEYQLLIRDAFGSWTEVANGVFGGSKMVYFGNDDGKYVSTYEADAVKLVIPNQSGRRITIAELDVLGPTGDNVDFRATGDGIPAVGVLSKAYQFGEELDQFIPEGSVVFTGMYKGSPAYNVVLLYDENGNIVGGTDEEGYLKAQQIILADVPEEGDIQNVSDGTWIYWIEPEDYVSLSGVRVRAELYRVNNALTNEGQRMVSDSFFITVPETLPEVTFTDDKEEKPKDEGTETTTSSDTEPAPEVTTNAEEEPIVTSDTAPEPEVTTTTEPEITTSAEPEPTSETSGESGNDGTETSGDVEVTEVTPNVILEFEETENNV